jgi:hypothetical protein
MSPRTSAVHLLCVRGERSSRRRRSPKSYDRGDQWSAADEGIESVAVFALAMDPNEPSVLYVTGPEGTYKTTSGGESRQERASQALGPDRIAQ